MEKELILTTLMPQLKRLTESNKEQMINYFNLGTASRGCKLVEENQKGDNIYVLVSGKAMIEKKYLNTKNIYYKEYNSVTIGQIDVPQFFGEELLFDSEGNIGGDNNYQYTFKVDSMLMKFYYIPKKYLNINGKDRKFAPDIVYQI